jgi:hypothetical protein
VGHLVFRDLTMTGVKNAIVISEYYPKVLPPADEAPQPVGRLTPHFHDITIENVTATGSSVAGAIAGLPESPVENVILRNVKISAQTGLTIGYASVTATNLQVQAAQGNTIIQGAGAQLVVH